MTEKKKGIWWKYSLLLVVLIAISPVIHFVNQARRGHPLDINYFWSELSPLALFGQGLYNGNGGKDWKIGQSKLNLLTANEARSRDQLNAFALELVNRDRTLNQTGKLTLDSLLTETAQRHAEDMSQRNYFNHVTPEGKNPRDRFLASGGSKLVAVGENISQSGNKGASFTYGIAEELQRGWMYSNGHRENLLTKKYKKFGYGIATSPNGKLYAVQMFTD
ncbi:CAP domain-containing protein [Calothrix sp. PCC 6303]|uniref:CAP domain-containing protein n=1 Tax=Calothrix sp. PCC 6303 TaxID=1170562 RepID=UPI0002A0447E|nr:CAP domain-containing protein [Calothrix sp. PCC 6303]AFZ02022.1 SCP-like extracellular [Calothrix sp. PCC 6303]